MVENNDQIREFKKSLNELNETITIVRPLVHGLKRNRQLGLCVSVLEQIKKLESHGNEDGIGRVKYCKRTHGLKKSPEELKMIEKI